MHFWSKGLGRRSHLVIACGTETPVISEDSKTVVLYGRTKPPVVWNYTMTMEVNDFLSILDLGLSKIFVKFLLHPKRIISSLKLLFYVIVMLIKFPFVKKPKEESKEIPTNTQKFVEKYTETENIEQIDDRH